MGFSDFYREWIGRLKQPVFLTYGFWQAAVFTALRIFLGPSGLFQRNYIAPTRQTGFSVFNIASKK